MFSVRSWKQWTFIYCLVFLCMIGRRKQPKQHRGILMKHDYRFMVLRFLHVSCSEVIYINCYYVNKIKKNSLFTSENTCWQWLKALYDFYNIIKFHLCSVGWIVQKLASKLIFNGNEKWYQFSNIKFNINRPRLYPKCATGFAKTSLM